MSNKTVVYFSGSILGKLNQPTKIAINLVKYIKSKGILVLDTYAASRKYNDESPENQKVKKENEPWFKVESNDINDIDKSTHLIALINGPSHGVGMEIQRAIDKVEMGKPETKILCLVQKNRFENVSWMIKGKNNHKYPNFQIKTYLNQNDAKKIIDLFLNN
jgi:hypothetical protein